MAKKAMQTYLNAYREGGHYDDHKMKANASVQKIDSRGLTAMFDS